MNRYFVFCFIAVCIQGCSYFTSPKAHPVIEDRVSQHEGKSTTGVLATTPERRVVLVKMPENKICAEPPADAADNLASSLSAIAEGSVQGKVTDAQLKFASTLATSVKQLFVRSQGIQLYRDGTFMLCIAFLNGAINKEEFLTRQQKLLETVAPLIEKEIPYLYQRKYDVLGLPVAPAEGEPTVTGEKKPAPVTPSATVPPPAPSPAKKTDKATTDKQKK
jgi:hypothetical protein